jgi:SAM-dependent methyltransferase
VKCPVCSDPAPRLVKKVQEYVLYECPGCDVGFSNPMRAADAAWYENSPLYLNAKALHVPLGWHHERFLALAGPGGGRSLLDVGCGTGTFLDRARSQGFVPSGLDFDRHNIELARSRYQLTDIHACSIEAFAARGGARHGVVTLFEVIEHVPDPLELLRLAGTMAEPGGLVALSTPNRNRRLDSLRHGDEPPNHLTRWSPRALCGALERAGLTVESLEVRPFDAEDIAAWLRARIQFGVARRMLSTGASSGDAAQVQRAAGLMRGKDLALRAVARPFEPLGRALGWPGSGLLALASTRR